MSIWFHKDKIMGDFNHFAEHLPTMYPFIENVKIIDVVNKNTAKLGFDFQINKFLFQATMLYDINVENEYALQENRSWSLKSTINKEEENYDKAFLTIGEFVDKAQEIAYRQELSKSMSFILRHHPEKFNIKLDNDGFCELSDLLKALTDQKKWKYVTSYHVLTAVEKCPKQRYFIQDNKIKANYGHSTKVEYVEKQPPSFLIHGTNTNVVDIILKEGLKKMGRQKVHLSESKHFAQLAGQRRGTVAFLGIDTKKAIDLNAKFYYAGNEVWLADFVPPNCIKIMK